MTDKLTLNVGGHIFETTKSTLVNDADSGMLGAMFSGKYYVKEQYIDRDGTLFRYVLNFLRTRKLALPKDFKELHLLEIEADFYQIQGLIQALKEYRSRPEQNDVVLITVSSSLDRSDYTPRPSSNPIPASDYVTIGTSSEEAKKIVEDLQQTLSGEIDLSDYVAALIAGLLNNGFSIQTQVAVPAKSSMSDNKYTWTLARKTKHASSPPENDLIEKGIEHGQ